VSRPHRIARIVARWDDQIVVHPHLTTAQWRALRRGARLRAAVGFALAGLALTAAAVLFVQEPDERLARSIAMVAAVTAVLVFAVSVVGLIDSRRHLDLRYPQWFSRRRGASQAWADASVRGWASPR